MNFGSIFTYVRLQSTVSSVYDDHLPHITSRKLSEHFLGGGSSDLSTLRKETDEKRRKKAEEYAKAQYEAVVAQQEMERKKKTNGTEST